VANPNVPREILIVKPSSLGDVVHTLPSSVELRRAFPEAKIRWLINTEWKPLLEGLGHIDEIIEFPRRDFRGARGLLRVGPWASDLRKRINSDLVLDYQGLLRSALIARLCRGSNGRVVGLDDAREGARLFYQGSVSTAGCVHAVDRYLALTRRVTGLAGDQIEWPLPEGKAPSAFAGRDAAPRHPLSMPDETSNNSRSADASERHPYQMQFVVMHPFSRGEGKSLTSEQVGAFCEYLAPIQVVIVGRADQQAPKLPNVIDLLNATDLHELIWLLRHAQIVVSVDSGPMHIAAAVSNRLVSIHTWSDPARVGPYRADAWIWQSGRLFQQRDRENSVAHREMANVANLAEFVKTQL
jgi:ADP-heptose:LPS heptosyltransferase